MQLTPRYDAPVILVVDNVGDPSVPLLRQRRRFAAMLQSLTDEQWAAASRCEGWSVQDVVMHLLSTDQFWTISFDATLRGEPTKFLTGFDPVASPAESVARMQAMTPGDVLAKYLANLAALEAVVERVETSQWDDLLAEAPPGHLSLGATALHALWDSWIHERDIAIPLGLAVVEEDDEIELALRYAVGLSPAFYASTGSTRQGTLCIETSDPDLSLLVHAGSSVRVTDGASPTGPRLKGRSVDLLEALSYRAELDHDLGDDDVWLLAGLAAVFDKA